MKRRKFLRYLNRQGCVIDREGKEHTIVANPAENTQSSVPRHAEIPPNTVRLICKQLGISLPKEK